MSSSGPSCDDVSPVERPTGGSVLASGKPPNPTGLVGRGEEVGRLDELVATAASGRSGVLLLEGEPGVGKTSLLEAARCLAAGFTSLTVRGVEAERQLAHAGLLGLLSPIRELVSEVPAPQAAALGSALGWSSATGSALGHSPADPDPDPTSDPGPASADRFLVGAATLSLLAAASERGPVLVLVDDLHWLDRESASAIVFAARRLGSDAVAFVIATRAGAGAGDLVRDLPALRVEGLPAAEAASLLPGGITAAVRERLVADTGGNPLALLEVARGLSGAQRIGAAPLPAALPAGDRLRGLYREALAGLSPDTWRAVLQLALGVDPGPDGQRGPRRGGGAGCRRP